MAVGTLYEIPVSLPWREGITSPTALAAPVVEGITLPNTLLPVLQSFMERASTTFCLAVAEWIVDIRPSFITQLSSITFARGARQLVVQEALEITCISGLYSLWFTP